MIQIPATKAFQRRVLGATSISYVIVILDTSIVNVALERIAHALSTDIAGLQWVVNAYTLAFACLLLTGGNMGDRWGARNVYLVGLALFTLASALCGFAPNLRVLTIARLLQGVGAALLVPCSLSLLNNAYVDPGERTNAVGIWAGCGGAALAAGPLAGGLLIDLIGWRSIFLVNMPIGMLGIWLTWRIGDDEIRHVRRFDLPGQLAAILALGILIAILIQGPMLGWLSMTTLAGMAACLLAWGALFAIERSQEQPMLPLSFFENRIFSASTFVAMTTTLTFFGLIFILSLYFQQVRDYQPLRTGLAFLPLTAMVTGGNIVSGRWAKAQGPRRPVLLGFGCSMIGFVGVMFLMRESSNWLLSLPMLSIGLGGGLITPAATAALMGTVEKSQSGVAAGILNSPVKRALP